VLWVWIVSSVVEEIFCRGWFQSLAAGLDAGDPRAARAAVIWSTALFGSLHFVLLAGGIDLGTFAVILVSVTTLGYVCALARARSGSLVPAITAHVAFNVGGGFVGGLLYAIVYRIATGRLPFAR
jgi:membrane protease YdiL (CAAX protease family)